MFLGSLGSLASVITCGLETTRLRFDTRSSLYSFSFVSNLIIHNALLSSHHDSRCRPGLRRGGGSRTPSDRQAGGFVIRRRQRGRCSGAILFLLFFSAQGDRCCGPECPSPECPS